MKSAAAETTKQQGRKATAGQSHEAMFECGRRRGISAVREKCAAKMELLTAQELAVETKFEGERVHGFGLGSSVGRARPW